MYLPRGLRVLRAKPSSLGVNAGVSFDMFLLWDPLIEGRKRYGPADDGWVASRVTGDDTA